MSHSRPPLSPEVRALLDRERALPSVPASVRARALARARAALVAGRLEAPAGIGGGPRMRWGVALAAAGIASAAVGTTAYEIGAHRRSLASERTVTTTQMVENKVAAVPPAPAAPAPPVTEAPSSAPPPATRAAHASPAVPGPEELRLLQQARSAVLRRDFAGALTPIGEHARRFRDGRLAEEREALRVKALSGLGRSEAARHAADAFEARFPRSVLLPAVSKMPASAP